MAAFLIVGGLVWLLLTGHDGVGLLLGGLAGLVGAWLESRIWPEAPCWAPWCQRGRMSSSPFCPKAWRRCFVCRGSGRRRRALAGSGS